MIPDHRNKGSFFLVSINHLTVCYVTWKKNSQTTHKRKKDKKEVHVLKWFWPDLLWSLRYRGYLSLLCHWVFVLQYHINRNTMNDQRCLLYSKNWNIWPEDNHQPFENFWMCDYEHTLKMLGNFQALSYCPDFFINCKHSDILACCRYTCNLPLCKHSLMGTLLPQNYLERCALYILAYFNAKHIVNLY